MPYWGSGTVLGGTPFAPGSPDTFKGPVLIHLLRSSTVCRLQTCPVHSALSAPALQASLLEAASSVPGAGGE